MENIENTSLEIPFFKPFFDESESELIRGALNGEKSTAIFEAKVASYYSAKHAIATNNTTASKHLTFFAINIKILYNIISPINTFVIFP